MRARRLSWLILGGLAACAPATSPRTPAAEPSASAPVATPPERTPSPPAVQRPIAPADAAFASGWMPLAATGVPAFRRAHPEADGRGVLIAILDSGIDPGAAGLSTTSTGDPKILDLRDFSAEGRIHLDRVVPEGDHVAIAGVRLAGLGRVRALTVEGPLYGGALDERRLGRAPAADLNGDGDDEDVLPLLVAQASDGWIVLADTDGDGTLADEQPIHDYALRKETFGWHRPGDVPPLKVAVNLSRGADGTPTLDLLFDTSGHGTHVAGIAAGRALHGVPGFDGVAPGAQLLGLKISNNAHGGISTTGSMLRALDHAIRFAAARRRALVVNLSFGVGNEAEGTARIDQLIDSVLAAHPTVLLVSSAGNDGPGLSTMGFPATADRVLTVGATLPLVFVERSGSARKDEPDPVAYFSARGGDAAKPDVVAPGIAYSAVPGWRVGEERSVGTSMAAPHVAGLAALLLSGLSPEVREVTTAGALKQALMVTARPTPGATFLDEGTGVPDLPGAWRWLQRGHPTADIRVRTAQGGLAAWRPAGLASPGDTVQEFLLLRPAEAAPARYRLRSDAGWLVAPGEVELVGPESRVTVRYRPSALDRNGVQVGVVSGWGPDAEAGPAFRLVNAVAWPLESDGAGDPIRLTPGGTGRLFIPLDSGQAVELVVRSVRRFQTLLTSLHVPGGMPFLGENGLPAGFGDAGAVYHIDGRDAVPGLWELDVVASPTEAGVAVLEVTRAPLRLAGARDPGGLEVQVTNLTDRELPAKVGAALIGGERGALVTGLGSAAVSVPFTVPAWARGAVVDLAMPPEQWSRFTDFGFSLLESDGRVREKAPLDYAAGRLTTDFGEEDAGRTLRLALLPGLADERADSGWSARLAIRLYADSALTLATQHGTEDEPGLRLGPRATAPLRFAMVGSPWELGDGFFPLGLLLAEAEGKVWTREVGLPAPIPPPMRKP